MSAVSPSTRRRSFITSKTEEVDGVTGRTEAHLISRYRSELMGIAMLWVMLFHCFLVSIDQPLLKAVKDIGFCGVDIFIVMSGMGQYVSLAKNGRLKDYR